MIKLNLIKEKDNQEITIQPVIWYIISVFPLPEPPTTSITSPIWNPPGTSSSKSGKLKPLTTPALQEVPKIYFLKKKFKIKKSIQIKQIKLKPDKQSLLQTLIIVSLIPFYLNVFNKKKGKTHCILK